MNVSNFIKCFFISVSLLFYLPLISSGEGHQFSGDVLENELLSIGVVSGDPEISLIKPSPYAMIKNDFNYNSDYFYFSYTIAAADIFLNWNESSLPNLGILSGIMEIVGKYSFNPDTIVGIGLLPGFYVGAYTNRRTEAGYFGKAGGYFETNIGLWSKYSLFNKQSIISGIGINLVLFFDNIQNQNFNGLMLYPLNYSLWIKYTAPYLPEIDVSLINNKTYNAFNCTIDYSILKEYDIFLKSEYKMSKEHIIPDSLTLETGVSFFYGNISFVPSFSYVKYNQSKSRDEFKVTLKASMSLFGGKHNVRVNTENYLTTFDYNSNEDPTLRYLVTHDQFSGYYWNMHQIVRERSYSEFLSYVENNVNSHDEVVLLAKFLGYNLSKYNYHKTEADKETFWEESLSDTANDEMIYNAMRESLINDQKVPITVCRGIHRFIPEIVNNCQVPGVEAYAIDVSYEAEGHVVSLITTSDQNYVLDYSRVMPMGSNSIETAIQIYQNYYSYPDLVHYLCNDNGVLLDVVDTPDGRLIKKHLTVQRDKSWNELLEEMAERSLSKR